MNVAFHTLAAIGITHATSTRLAPEGPAWRLAPGDGVPIATAFVLGVMSHGVLDGLHHYYPFGSAGDTVVSAVLFLGWAALLRPRYRLLLLIAFVGALLPDIIDHVPRDLNRHLGLSIPVPEHKLFPWHWPEGSGSHAGTPRPLPDPLAITSITNHVLVVGFVAATVAATRGALRKLGRQAG